MRVAIFVLCLVGSSAAQQFAREAGRPTDLPLPIRGTGNQLALADVDGDGDDDVAVSDDGGIAFLRNLGSRAWSRTELIPFGSATAFAWSDMDGDGDLDLVAGADNAVDTPFAVFRNDGASFTYLGRILGMRMARVLRLAVGDVDGDGDNDVLVGLEPLSATAPRPYLRLFRNDGSAGLTQDLAAVPALAGSAFTPALADLDGDGDLDALVGAAGGAAILLENTGGTYRDVSPRLPLGTSSIWSAGGDLDGDNDTDFVNVNANGQLDVLTNQGALNFSLQPSALVTAGGSAQQCGLSDFDADGDLDVFARMGNEADVHLNQGGGSFVRQAVERRSDRLLRALAAGDTLGRPETDLVTTWSASLHHVHYGATPFLVTDLEPAGLPVGDIPTSGLAAGDLDGDGLSDLVAGGASSGDVRVLRNLGLSRFGETGIATAPSNLRHIELADFDGDGDLDILTVHSAWPTSSVEVLRNGGGLGFSATGRVTFAETVVDLEVGDVDGDSDPDVVVTANTSLRLLRNAGPLGLVDAGPIPGSTVPVMPRRFLLADFDGDSDPDLLIGSGVPGCLALLRNDGSGAFPGPAGCVPFSGLVSALSTADVDGDVDLDIAVVDSATGQPFLFLNDGRGNFAASPAPLPSTGGTYVDEARFADVDDDGDADLLLGGNSTYSLLVNAGSGSFADASSRMAGVTRGAATALADLDQDGALDLVVAGRSQLLLFANRQRSVDSLGLVQPGGQLRLRWVSAPGFAQAGTMCLPAIALAAAPAPLRVPGIDGALSIDPATMFLQALTPIPAGSGQVTLITPVPPRPSLLGLDLFAQGLYSSPSGLAFGAALRERILP